MAKIFLHSSVSSLNPDFSNANPAFSSCVLHICGQILEAIDGRCLKINNIVFASWSSLLCIVQLSPVESKEFNHEYENIKYLVTKYQNLHVRRRKCLSLNPSHLIFFERKLLS